MAEEDDEFRSLTDPDSDPESIPMFFDRNRHICYLEMMLELIPSPYQSQEINRLTLAYFTISGLDILRALDRVDKEGVINWVLSLQAHPRDEAELSNGQFYGFHGSRSSQFQSNENGDAIPNGSHLASTYCALSILKTLDYDFSLLDSTSIVKSMKNLQQPDGRYFLWLFFLWI
uniref:Geranylgeranyl transferase type-1 subunit beta-like n=1 Tax=Nicotiana tabacum TaxID=4097 RepID=A0A1S3X456_TOBAC